ncbi:BgTH12-00654 [Blumeria graminis f. sp. triticale]|uniref:BgtASP-20145 n=3 Tax=Blumeria graminis TaxID=34373 RepID=A0A9X9MMJ5_BLUGR|nr:hypothetical protein BGT96224_ASP20145 [Blumeria graminis f. sp. tritici 96224]CAD6505159.1 BgTH12-00654 [Blumeria graminis f. sp. triticale]VDB93163.1 BgtASP-20145 [Blumeria graminis f. sp. tritici]
MHFSLFSSLALLALAAAEATTFSIGPADTTSTVCGAQPVLDACIASTSAIANACPTTDYNCLCQKYTDVLTCFNVCPNDPRRSATLSSQSAYCSNANVYSSSTSSAISRPVSATTTSLSTTTAVSHTTEPIAEKTTSATTTAAPTSTSGSSAQKIVLNGVFLLGAGAIALL